MSKTGEELLQGLAETIGNWWSSTTTSAGASDGTTIVDTALQAFGEDELVDGWVRVTNAGSNVYAVRRVTDFLTSTITVAPALPAQMSTAHTYQFFRFDPREMFKALDKARIVAYPQLAILRLNEAITADGENNEYGIPATMRKGPVEVWQEALLSPTAGWNALGDPALTTLSSKWTASGTTATLVTRDDSDLLVPKHESTCVKLAGSGTYTQDVANMGLTAAQMAGRRLTFGVWVFQRATTGTATVRMTHSSATVSSSTHGGAGWELLTVTATVPSGNSIFTVDITTGGAVTVFAEHAFLGAMDRLPQRYPQIVPVRGIIRDDTVQTVRLARTPPRGYQLRLVGRDPLTSLGQTASTQGTRSMEVDEFTAQLLFAKAARILFSERGMAAASIKEQFPFIAEAEARFNELAPDWEYDLPHETRLNGWWQLAAR